MPVDRAYTQTFFGWHSPEFQSGQREFFSLSLGAFATLAREVQPERFVGEGWNSSRSKVIDNAIVGMLRLGEPRPLQHADQGDSTRSTNPELARSRGFGAMTSPSRGAKYAPLIEYLKRQSGDRVTLSFAEVERILGSALPKSARMHSAWWANESEGTHTWAHGWIKAGWLKEEVSFAQERVTFVRK